MQPKNIVLDKAGITQIYQQSFRDDQAAITKNTKMVIDTHRLNLPNCQSIVLDKVRGALFTQHSTNSLVKDFVHWQKFNFTSSTFIARKFYHDHVQRHIVPFVSLDQALLPISGYARASTSWIMQSNLLGYTCLGNNKIGLQFRRNHLPEYIILEKKKQFEDVYRLALLIEEIQILSVESLMKGVSTSFISKIHDEIDRLFPEKTQIPRNLNIQAAMEEFIDQIIEDTLYYDASLIDEQLDKKYILQVQKAVQDKQKRLR